MAVSIHGQKIKEGDKFMEEGEKWWVVVAKLLHEVCFLGNPTIDTYSLKTGIFKWSPNYEGAAQAFSRAGQ